MAFAVVLLAAVAAVSAATSTPMNTVGPYIIANPPVDKPATQQFRGEYFEVLSPPIRTQYAEVFWQPQHTDLPPEIVSRFHGSVMAVTGMEVDIVRKGDDGNFTSVSCYEQYNHHYTGALVSAKVAYDLSEGAAAASDGGSHGNINWRVLEPATSAPTIQIMSEGNGNEHRLSFKGYPNGYAQLIESPTAYVGNPMIINTKKSLTDDNSPGPISNKYLPRHSLAPPNATYSGLLECPCTSRKLKISDAYATQRSGSCGAKANTAQECAAAVANVGLAPATNVSVVSRADMPPGCSASLASNGQVWQPTFNSLHSSTAPCGPAPASGDAAAATTVAATTNVQTLVVVQADGTVQITLAAAADGKWFGVGFNASAMADLPYAIIVDGSGNVQERKLANHAAGTALTPSVTVDSNTVTAGRRVVVLHRPAKGATPNHYTFSSTTATLPLITAVGNTPTLAAHRATATAQLSFTKLNGGSLCVCRDPNANSGTIDGRRFNSGVCAAFPKSELLTKHNAICNFTAYEGGLYCCHGGTILLDAEQQTFGKYDEFYMKYRFYYEPEPVSTNLFRLWWSTEATNNEYDVPKSTADCSDPNTPAEDCVYELTSQFTGADMFTGAACMAPPATGACGDVQRVKDKDGGKFKLVYAAAHCHAPACMSLELWDRDQNKLICRNEPTYGSSDKPQDEASYVVAIPPCLWGDEPGLQPPPVLHLDSNYTTIKRVNNTNGHWGVMALWQMRGAYYSS